MEQSSSDRPYLGPDVSEEEVDKALGKKTIWEPDNAGRFFEQQQKAKIKGCDPGNFPFIDATGKVSDYTGKEKEMASSLKTIDLNTGNFEDADAWENFHGIVGKHLNQLMQFRNAQGNLVNAKGEVQEVTCSISEFKALELRIGVQESIFNTAKAQMLEAAKSVTDSSLGGTNQVSATTISHGPVPVLTRILPIPDNFYKTNTGENYEVLKGAEIHGQPPAQFKTVDKLSVRSVRFKRGKRWFQKKVGRVISYKTHDVLNCYASVPSFQSVLLKELSTLAEFSSYTEPNGLKRTIKSEDYEEKRLSVAIPMVGEKQMQRLHPALMAAFKEAKKKGLTFRVHRVA
ncbi:MAG: hypothetical protein JNL98_07220 [Bryobacterales bacterium]|nr:hypothetical protein [Bryobacterales bacterium]